MSAKHYPYNQAIEEILGYGGARRARHTRPVREERTLARAA